ncbi:MAG: hypothetical protein SGPRY_006618 [Prymnesium sp.]
MSRGGQLNDDNTPNPSVVEPIRRAIGHLHAPSPTPVRLRDVFAADALERQRERPARPGNAPSTSESGASSSYSARMNLKEGAGSLQLGCVKRPLGSSAPSLTSTSRAMGSSSSLEQHDPQLMPEMPPPALKQKENFKGALNEKASRRWCSTNTLKYETRRVSGASHAPVFEASVTFLRADNHKVVGERAYSKMEAQQRAAQAALPFMCQLKDTRCTESPLVLNKGLKYETRHVSGASHAHVLVASVTFLSANIPLIAEMPPHVNKPALEYSENLQGTLSEKAIRRWCSTEALKYETRLVSGSSHAPVVVASINCLRQTTMP